MRYLLLLLLFLIPNISFSQVRYGSKLYYGRVCNNPNCRMCNTIENRLTRAPIVRTPTYPTIKPLEPLVPIPTPQYKEGDVANGHILIRAEESVPFRVKTGCVNGICTFETRYKTIRKWKWIPLNTENKRSSISLSEVKDIPHTTTKKEIPNLSTHTELVPTPDEALDYLFTLIDISKSDVVIEPGCGDGRFLARVDKGIAVGIDLNANSVTKARGNAPRAIIVQGDARDIDYSKATIVYMYLYPELMEDILAKLPKGTTVISYLHDISPIKAREFSNGDHTFYIGTT